MTAGDRAGKSHWESTWRDAEVPHVDQVLGPSLRHHVNRELARFLKRWLGHQAQDPRLLELGCARSIWLPYLSTTLGYSVTGIDYSERGCELARATLAAASSPGQIVLADFFHPPFELLGQFDAVVSFGVAEHFDDTAACIASFARFLRPNGRIVTVIPNLTGLTGFLQKHLNRALYEKHVPLGAGELAAAHRAADLSVLASGYLISSNFGILNLEGLSVRSPTWLAKRVLLAALGRLSVLGWMAERHLPVIRVFAAYGYCVAEKTGPADSSPH